MTNTLRIAFMLAALFAVNVQGQLAVTEIMTSESTTAGGVAGAPAHNDWWELSNYGTNDIDLTGYSWNDNAHNGLYTADYAPFTGVTIHAGEALVIAETTDVITDADSFRAWWGIGTNVQVLLSPAGQGLSSGGDSVRLWRTNNSNFNFDLTYDEAPQFLVDHSDTGTAIAGKSFSYNTNNGLFDVSSTNGIAGAFLAVTADDEGSPGIAPPMVPVIILQQPTNFSTTVGQTAVFSIAGRGLPKPTFQWLYKGNPVDTNVAGVTITVTNGTSTLALSTVQTNQAGNYSVLISNGLTNFASSNAVLAVNPAPTPPASTQTPTNVTAYIGQTVTFTTQATGNPAPNFTWQWSGGEIIGVVGTLNSNVLVLSIAGTNQSGTYTAVVSNTAGTTNISATLTATTKPNLVITEVMSAEAAPTTGHADWWELSNFDTFAVNLRGFRMNDSHALTSAYTITNNAVIQPGESVVFVEGITAAAFRTWWGNSLPANLQIITYDGSGRGLSASSDEVRLWNQVATDENDRVANVAFSTAVTGVSFGFDPDATNQLGFSGNSSQWLSTSGLNGAFVSAVSGDIGSPGRVVNWPGNTAFKAVNGVLNLTWSSQPNRPYAIQSSTNLLAGSWTTLTNVSAVSNSCTVTDLATNAQRFYRVVLTKTP